MTKDKQDKLAREEVRKISLAGMCHLFDHEAVELCSRFLAAWQKAQGKAVAVDLGNNGEKWPDTMDGMVWAQEFHNRFPCVSIDDALCWFCNAIMRGYDRANQRRDLSPAIQPAREAELLAIIAKKDEALRCTEYALMHPSSDQKFPLEAAAEALALKPEE